VNKTFKITGLIKKVVRRDLLTTFFLKMRKNARGKRKIMENMYLKCNRELVSLVKKLNLNKKVRISMLLICSICIITMAVLLYYECKVPHFQDEKIALYKYNSKADINTRISFLPNNLYDPEAPVIHGVYLTNLVNRINTIFQYQFYGERAANINGVYKVTAEVEGYTGEKETYKTIWKKSFMLIPETSFEEYNDKLNIQEEISVNLADYKNFVNQIEEVSKVNCPVKLTVYMDVSLKAQTQHGIIEERVNPSMVIPLNTGYFEITKNIPPEKQSAIEETRQVQLPVNKNLIIIYSGVLGIMLILLLCTVFLTVGTEKDSFTKALNKIFKKHGSRLVALNSNIPGSLKDYNKVKSIDDLVRIADEIGKPIMYKYSAEPKEITHFYVWDENQLFLFDLKEAVKKMEEEKLQKGIKKSIVKREKDIKGASAEDKVVLNNSK